MHSINPRFTYLFTYLFDGFLVIRTITGERDVDKSVVDVMFAGRQIERAPVVNTETR